MDIVLISAEIIILSLVDYFAIKYKAHLEGETIINIKRFIPTGWKQCVCFLVIPLSMATVAGLYHSLYSAEQLEILKRLCVISVLWVAAVTDYREYRIPNSLIIYGIILRAIVLIAEFIKDMETAVLAAKDFGIAVIGVVVVCLICMILTHGSLGMGDVKLLMVMASFLGIDGICGTVFVSVFFSAVAAVALLVLKKKSTKDAIPFAPFILAGTVVCLALTGV